MLPEGMTLQQALNSDEKTMVMTTELKPPRDTSHIFPKSKKRRQEEQEDQTRFDNDKNVLGQMMSAGVDGILTSSLPKFSRGTELAATSIRKKMIQLEKKYPKYKEQLHTWRQILLEVRCRVPSYELGDLGGNIGNNHIMTLACQCNHRQQIRDILERTDFSGASGLFVVSGGHPCRKLVDKLHKSNLPEQILREIEQLLLHGVDSVSIMQDVREIVGGHMPTFGAWSYYADGEERIQQKEDVGMKGLISQLSSLKPRTFEEKLTQLRQSDTKLKIFGNVGLIHSPAELNFWHALTNINPQEDPEAAEILASFRRAKKDGYLPVFCENWAQNSLEWILSLDVDGVNYTTSKHDEQSYRIFEKATGKGQYPTAMDANLKAKKEIHAWGQKYHGLDHTTSIHTYAQAMHDKNISNKNSLTYPEEFLPILEQSYHAIRSLQEEYPQSDVWKDLDIHFVRIPQNNHAHTLPVEHIRSDDGKINELRIDYRQCKKNAHEIIQKELVLSIEKKQDSDMVYLDDKNESVPMHERASEDGWNYFQAIQQAWPKNKKSDPGVQTALRPKVINICAEKALESLLRAPTNLDEYVMMEFGCSDANGIPEMLDALDQAISDHDLEDELRKKLIKTKLIGVDKFQEGVDSFMDKLNGKYDHLLGKGIVGIECDVLNKSKFDRHMEPFAGRVIFSRSVNIIDALQSPIYKNNGAKLYRVNYRTVIHKSDITNCLQEPITYSDGKNDQTYNIIEHPLLSSEHLLHVVQEGKKRKGSEAQHFIQHLVSNDIPEPAAILVWERIKNIFKKRHTYTQCDPDENPSDNLAYKVASMHPDNKAWFASSMEANSFTTHVADLLHPCGNAVSFQLTKSLGESNSIQREPSDFGIVPCRPVQAESFCTNGFDATFTPGPDLGLRSSSSMLILKKKSR